MYIYNYILYYIDIYDVTMVTIHLIESQEIFLTDINRLDKNGH